jgi:hypothetical protein
MKRAWVIVLVAAVVVGSPCFLGDVSGAAPSAAEQLARKLDVWRAEARPALKARARREGPQGISQAFEELAKPFVEENSALLERLYADRLGRLPAAEAPDPKLFTKRAFQVDVGPTTVARLYPSAYRLWYPDPASAGRYWLDETLRNVETRESHELRRAVWAVVPPRPSRLPGPGPRIVFDDGDEVFVVTLKRAGGLTLPVEIEWWTRQ